MKILATSGTILFLMSGLAVASDLQRLLSVKGMSCTACPPQVERESKKLPGVKAAHVDFKSGQAKIVADERVKSGDLVSRSEQRRLQSGGAGTLMRISLLVLTVCLIVTPVRGEKSMTDVVVTSARQSSLESLFYYGSAIPIGFAPERGGAVRGTRRRFHRN